MQEQLTRRDFSRLLGIGTAAGSALFAADPTRKLKIGHTGITWDNDSEAAVRDVSALGYYGFETFGNVLENWAANPDLQNKIGRYKLPLISAYCSFNLVDPAKKKDELEKMSRLGTLIKQNGGSVSVLGPNSVPRASYDFKASKANIVETLNDCAKMLSDMGLTAVLHQHTGTCVETRDEVYAVLDAVDTRYVSPGPISDSFRRAVPIPCRS